MTAAVLPRPHPARRRRAALLAAGAAALLASLAFLRGGRSQAADASTGPFAPGEELEYRIRWGFITAGHARLQVLPLETYNGQSAYRFTLTARTTPFVDRLYKVRDVVHSVTAADMSRALEFAQDQQEGGTMRQLQVYFDWDDTPQAWRVLNDEAREPVSIEPGTFDPLSGVYALRQSVFVVGSDIELPVTDGKTCVRARGTVLREETIKTPAGKFETFVVQPELSEVRAVFERSPNATMLVWVSKDERRLPVRVTSEVFIGHFTAELTHVTP